MSDSHKNSEKFETLNPGRLTRLRNRRCPYCGEEIGGSVESSVDHVIGRRFVPKGSLAKSWNLLVNSHKKCNAEKAEYENDISATTLQMFVANPSEDPLNANLLEAEAARKGRARSSLTHRRVNESHSKKTIKGNLGSAELAFTFLSPPSLAEERILRLAEMQVRGLSSLIFFDRNKMDFNYLPPCIGLVAWSGRGDWGNVRVKAFMETVRDWEHRLLGTGLAGGYFQAIIRKEPSQRPFWSWALEWNKTLRLMGFMGEDAESLEKFAAKLPIPTWDKYWQTDSPDQGQSFSRIRLETPLSPDEDKLFAP
jgi:hypothetical protein